MFEDLIGLAFSVFQIGADLGSDDHRKRRSAQISGAVLIVIFAALLGLWLFIEANR